MPLQDTAHRLINKGNRYIGIAAFFLVSYILSILFVTPLATFEATDFPDSTLHYAYRIAHFVFQAIGACLFGYLADIYGRRLPFLSALSSLTVGLTLITILSLFALHPTQTHYPNSFPKSNTTVSTLWLKQADSYERVCDIQQGSLRVDDRFYNDSFNSLNPQGVDNVRVSAASSNRCSLYPCTLPYSNISIVLIESIIPPTTLSNSRHTHAAASNHTDTESNALYTTVSFVDAYKEYSNKPREVHPSLCEAFVRHCIPSAIGHIYSKQYALTSNTPLRNGPLQDSRNVLLCMPLNCTLETKGMPLLGAIPYDSLNQTSSINPVATAALCAPNLGNQSALMQWDTPHVVVALASLLLALGCGGLYTTIGCICREEASDAYEVSYFIVVMISMQGFAQFVSRGLAFVLVVTLPDSSIVYLSTYLNAIAFFPALLLTLLAFVYVEETSAYKDALQATSSETVALPQITATQSVRPPPYARTETEATEDSLLTVPWDAPNMGSFINEPPVSSASLTQPLLHSEQPLCAMESPFVCYKRVLKPILRSEKRAIMGMCIPWGILNIVFYGYGILHFSFFNSISNESNRLEMRALSTFVVSALTLTGYVLNIYLLSRFHFKMLQFAGLVVMTVVYFGLFVCLYGIPFTTNTTITSSIIASILYDFMFHYFFCVPNCTTFFVPLQVSPVQVRATLHGLAVFSSRVGATLGLILSLFLLQTLDLSVTLLILCLLTLLAAFSTIKWTPYEAIKRSDSIRLNNINSSV